MFHVPWYDFLPYNFAFQFIITWLYDRTDGSVLIVMLFHLSSNIMAGGVMLPLFTGLDQTRYWWLFIALAWAIALVTIAHSWFRSDAARSQARVTLDGTN